MEPNLHDLIFMAIDGSISDADFERLQRLLESDPAARREYLLAVTLQETLTDVAVASAHAQPLRPVTAEPTGLGDRPDAPQSRRRNRLLWSGLAGLALVAIGAVVLTIGRQPPESGSPGAGAAVAREAEQRLAGHATIRYLADVRWSEGQPAYREGDMLPAGRLAFDGGVAVLDFFCGATVTIEGPARLEVVSDSRMDLQRGRLRAFVPPAARGFTVQAAETEIVDLGTEFVLEADERDARIQVLDGEVAFRGGALDGTHLRSREARHVRDGRTASGPIASVSHPEQLGQRRRESLREAAERWARAARHWRTHPRLIAYFDPEGTPGGRVVPNLGGVAERDGVLVGPVEHTAGRFGPHSGALQFSRPGARVRTRIDGVFQAFTFVCWARIDSLEHRYNALFMADGYENGEPHWQIRDDGRLMFSVMVDDTQDVRFFSKREGRIVRDAGLHRVYYTPPIWDISKAGRWFHLAAVYDPSERRVRQYVDGRPVSDERIPDRFHITDLRIGPAEIGNWGQPFRKTPWFAVRNLNGAIDELLIFDAPLSADEIRRLYEQGKPPGY
ncbi:MAG: hypothetical protein D6725_03270 [Planctomycetota bacterium]|nr:MAG: hypothetical protein D6725_03270 [Planctomycetota bacterium]